MANKIKPIPDHCNRLTSSAKSQLEKNTATGSSAELRMALKFTPILGIP